ncbi:helix-turn-helix transcriptional regulator [Fulvivirga sp. 29W222]|uniref:Helix-turn-helix transcriptional regulator n=1 Tax=Fulvivirga marina TaxID=2494733 RepID=A0A937G1A0_9BACT|nr:AraC family transcriptional regulator [Fulvivirga marina]MBL6448238.1 helix-turn-helix transcriptional regulator [Fulvivirga marina]
MFNATYIEKDFGWFVGTFDNNQKHQHYAIQLSIPINAPISILTDLGEITTNKPILIKPSMVHQIVSNSAHFVFLVNPASTIGHFWNKSSRDEITEFTDPPATELQNILRNKTSNSAKLQTKINEQIKSYDCRCSSFLHQGDARIDAALNFLKENTDRVVSLEEVSEHCHISPSRFLHVFKEQTGITYRRAQLWSKLVYALQHMGSRSLTEAAHSAGFSDSAHFSRTFKENFGFSPRDFLKLSRFIQV